MALQKNNFPNFLYGTAWKEEHTQLCVERAITAGFRGIDTANQRKHYFEIAVGAALQKCYFEKKITREEIFLQTKFTSTGGQDQRLPYDPQAALSDQVQQSFQSSLSHLHTDYIDSYILHGPTYQHDLHPEDWEIWRAMEELHQKKQVKFLGISNVNLTQLQKLYKEAIIKPTFVQNRCFARQGWDQEIRHYCSKNQIIYQGFSLLTANPAVFHHPHFSEIVSRQHRTHPNCTPAQIIFSFALQKGMLPLTGTTDPIHMKQDLESAEIYLSKEELQVIEEILMT